MPEMDGAQLLRHLADIQCQARIVLVSAISHDLMESLVQLGLSHGLRLIGSVHKPIGPQVLGDMLGRGTLAKGAAASTRNTTSGLDLTPARLRAAAQSHEIHPWYQPKVDSARLRVVGVEALARWRLPDGTLVGPDKFIPAMESQGLFDELFFCIFEQVLADLERWNHTGLATKAAINLSMDCAFHLDLPERMNTVLQRFAVSRDQIVIEVTESRLMEDRAAALETLSRISLAGFRLSMDDFGTGYSSLAQVASLPFNELKVDASFVQRALVDRKARAIVLSVVTLGSSLELDVVAEGVETIEQLDLLRGCNAPTIQGYLIARPMPCAQLLEWIGRWRPGSADRPGSARHHVLLQIGTPSAHTQAIAAELALHVPQLEALQTQAQDALLLDKAHQVDAITLDLADVGRTALPLLQALRNKYPSARLAVLDPFADDTLAAQISQTGALHCPQPPFGAQAVRIADFLAQN
jgi:EAL domain-containing protein (putative c-di-GMP-specific phosphodiesterase class I)/DNA-binding NarL/FixJ family response regulator